MRTNHEVRYRAVVHYCHFLRSLRRVANLYGVSKSSLQRWVAARGDPPQRRRAAGHPKPIDQAVRNCIEQVLTERPFTTSKELVDVLRDRCGLRTSRSTANRLVRRAGFTYKKAFRAVLPVHDAATVQGFCDRFKASEKVVCVDEAGFYVGDHSRRGYAKKGGRLRIQASRTLRRVKLTLLMAVSAEGVVGYEILRHNCRKADFVGFIGRLRVPSGTDLLMDNVAFHRSKDTLEAVEAKGCRALFIPPYSPRFNAIENVFGVAKARYRAACPTSFQDAFDYVAELEAVLRGIGSLQGYFSRVARMVDDVVATGGASFRGVD
jgi:transposase